MSIVRTHAIHPSKLKAENAFFVDSERWVQLFKYHQQILSKTIQEKVGEIYSFHFLQNSREQAKCIYLLLTMSKLN